MLLLEMLGNDERTEMARETLAVTQNQPAPLRVLSSGTGCSVELTNKLLPEGVHWLTKASSHAHTELTILPFVKRRQVLTGLQGEFLEFVGNGFTLRTWRRDGLKVPAHPRVQCPCVIHCVPATSSSCVRRLLNVVCWRDWQNKERVNRWYISFSDLHKSIKMGTLSSRRFTAVWQLPFLFHSLWIQVPCPTYRNNTSHFITCLPT